MMKKLMVFLCAIFLVFGMSVSAGATAYYLAGSALDVDKSYDGTDNLFCWAATASNMLGYTGWDAGYSGSGNVEDDIFDVYKSFWSGNYWTAGTGTVTDATEWWFYGDTTTQGSTTVSSGGDYYDSAAFSANFTSDLNISGIMDTIASWIGTSGTVNDGIGLYLVDRSTDEFHHYVSLWGYEITATDGSGNATNADIWVTNSDQAINGLEQYSLIDTGSYWDFVGSPYDTFNLQFAYKLNNWDGFTNPDSGLGRKKFFRR
jgi:hypothetical protein